MIAQRLDGRNLYVVAKCACGVAQWVRKYSVERAQRQGRQWSCPSCAHRANGAMGGWLVLPPELRRRTA